MTSFWNVLFHVVLLSGFCCSTEVIEITTETKMDVFSTNYPQPYPSQEDKEWRMSHDYGRWLIILQDFHIGYSVGCVKDYLEILEDNTRPKRYCGRKTKENIISTGSKVRIHFHSDETGKERGFRLTVKRLLDEDDMKRKSQAEAAKASVHVYQKDQPYDSWMFKVLIGSLGCATLVFTVLITFLCLEMRKKRLERRPRQFYTANGGVIQWPPRTRSDSKSYGRQNSNSSTAPLTSHERQGY